MFQPASFAPLSERRSVTVSLIGDLDAQLGEILAETLADLVRRGESDLTVDFDNVEVIEGSGLAAAARALAQHRLAGCAIAATARKRRVRSALNASRVPLAGRDQTPPPSSVRRHVMIAHNASL